MLIEAGPVAMAAKSSSDYTSFQSEYNSHLANYNSATVPAEIANHKALVDQARLDMNGANDQLVLFSSAAGIWVVNALHAFFLVRWWLITKKRLTQLDLLMTLK